MVIPTVTLVVHCMYGEFCFNIEEVQRGLLKAIDER
jgi:hypothetical protein